MKVVFKENKPIKTIVPIVGQEEENGIFIPMAIALIESELIIFSDLAPDAETEDSYYYDVKKRIPLSSISSVLDEKIIRNKKIKEYRRLHIVCKDVKNSIFFFYNKYEDKAYAKRLLILLKQAKIRVKKSKVDLGPLV